MEEETKPSLTRKAHRKSTNVELIKRHNECVERIINDNLNYTMFCDWYIDTYDLTKHNAHKDWVKSWNIIKSRFTLEREQLVNKQIYHLYDLFSKAVEIMDFSTSRKILEDIRKIQGIDTPEVINVNHTGTINVSFGDE